MAISSTNSINPDDLVAALRAYREQIPDYTQEAGLNGLASAANLHRDFVDAGINAIGASAALQQALNTTADACVQASAEATRWSAVEDELAALLTGVRKANLVRRHRLGIKVLQAYQVTKQLVRTDEGDNLRPHLAEMRRNNRAGRRTKTPQAPQAPHAGGSQKNAE
jgi:hypothetical protein